MWKKGLFFFLFWLILFLPSDLSKAYGEVSIKEEYAMSMSAVSLPGYQFWKKQIWETYGLGISSQVAVTVGKDVRSLNFTWYSANEEAGTPAVKISRNRDMKECMIFKGKAVRIDRSNGIFRYHYSNQVSVNGLKPDFVFYYSTTSNAIGTKPVWSKPHKVFTASKEKFNALLVSDVQIGASGSAFEGTAKDQNIPADTYQWEKLLNGAIQQAPDAKLLLSMGDQINYKHPDVTDSAGVRESEYAGFLFPTLLRNLPIAPVIGNHESKGNDFKWHFAIPSAENSFGKTEAGCDYYFRNGEVLVIVLNSNSRDMDAHEKLMQKAVKKNPGAKWRIVLMHHDLYGSGALHADTNSANLRILFAPLMDRFGIDACFSGHDHAYTRSYFMFDGTAIKYGKNKAVNPVGTLYVALASSSGSKFYPLVPKKQFFVAERSNQTIPSFSNLMIDKNRLTLKTYDVNGNKYADDYVILKTKRKKSYKKYKKIKLLHPLKKDTGAILLKKRYGKKDDPLTYYAYAQGIWKSFSEPKRLKHGFSSLLDKTMEKKWKISGKKLQKALQSLD